MMEERFSEPHYIAEAVYAEIFNLSDKGAFNTVSPDFARYVAGYKKTHNEVQDTLKEIALIEEKLLQKEELICRKRPASVKCRKRRQMKSARDCS